MSDYLNIKNINDFNMKGEVFGKKIEVVVDNLTINFYQYGTDGPIIIFEPGLGAHCNFYSKFLEEFAKRGYRIIGHDRRGHGSSEGERGNGTLNDNINEIKVFLELLQEKSELENGIGLIGTSFGGVLSLWLRFAEPRVISTICHGTLIYKVKVDFKDRIMWPLVKFLALIKPNYDLSIEEFLNPDEVFEDETIKNQYLNDPLALKKIKLRLLASYLKGLKIKLNSVTTPILLLTGERDKLFPETYLQKVSKKLAGKVEIISASNAGHFLFAENVPLSVDIADTWFKKTLVNI
ncbi:MAG: alpha/beta hydrolase [Candidatus Hodarchaeota archaeon]